MTDQQLVARIDERVNGLLERFDKLEAKFDTIYERVIAGNAISAETSTKIKVAFAIIAAVFAVLGGFAGNVIANIVTK